MNTFVHIKHIESFKKVNYYSICLNDSEVSLFEQFIQKHQTENHDKLYHIKKWLAVIGDKYGARQDYFRPEAEISDTSALPPKGKKREPTYIENDEATANPLRLYCFRVNDNVVFLYNGDIKTTLKAQDCKNVRPHFKLANVITKELDKAIREKNILWNDEYNDIRYNKNLKLPIP